MESSYRELVIHNNVWWLNCDFLPFLYPLDKVKFFLLETKKVISLARKDSSRRDTSLEYNKYMNPAFWVASSACWLLAWLTLRPWSCSQYVPPKCRWTSAQNHIPEKSTLDSLCCRNLKSNRPKESETIIFMISYLSLSLYTHTHSHTHTHTHTNIYILAHVIKMNIGWPPGVKVLFLLRVHSLRTICSLTSVLVLRIYRALRPQYGCDLALCGSTILLRLLFLIRSPVTS
jgi:hypothetical protein